MSAEVKSGETNNRIAGTGIDLWQELPRLSVMIMEISWVVPWFQVITLAVKDQSAWFIGLTLLMVVFLAYALAQAAFHLSIRDKIRQRLFLVYVIGAVVFSEWVILYRRTAPTYLWRLYNQSLYTLTDIRELILTEVMFFLIV